MILSCWHCRFHSIKVILRCTLIPSLLLLVVINAQKFEPYQLNGGLVSAVAGRDFCVVACDTRMIDGGYEIYSRRHTQSRLWGVHAATATATASLTELSNSSSSASNSSTPLFRMDGSVHVPPLHYQKLSQVRKRKLSRSVTFVASAGCNADCEGLKRVLRADIRVAEYYKNRDLAVDQIANVLSQTLYQRRGFPFYSFCVVGGLTAAEGEGAAYAYDAVGSYERVAVATAGTGQEMLQPILDRKFRTWQRPCPEHQHQQPTLGSDNEDDAVVKGDKMSVKQRRAGSPLFAVGHQVDCDVDEAVSILINAYRSVAEREIGVGDLVVLCVTERDDDGGVTCRVFAVPMKQH